MFSINRSSNASAISAILSNQNGKFLLEKIKCNLFYEQQILNKMTSNEQDSFLPYGITFSERSNFAWFSQKQFYLKHILSVAKY